jgi:hypothetical protein
MNKPLLLALAIVALTVPAVASDSVTVTAPIWSQTVAFTLPAGFVTNFENTSGNHYIREAVLKGETSDRWTQMITITGERNGAQQRITAKSFAETMADGFKRACPASFNAEAIGSGKISGYPSYAGILSCGTSPTTGGATSETAAVLVVVGKHDIYTLQWAARTPPSKTPMDLDVAAWEARLAHLEPIEVE